MRFLRVCGILCLIIAVQLPTFAGTYTKLKELYNRKSFFELRDALKAYTGDRSDELLFYRGAVSNKFNQLPRSIEYLNRYIRFAEKSKQKSLLKESYELLADNYLKTYQYRKAAEAYQVLLTDFRNELDKPTDYENSFRLWSALGNVPPQTVAFSGTSKIRSFKDQIDLTNIPLEINGQAVSLTFDTGANLSTVTATYASKLGLQIIDAAIDVGGSTGEKTKAKLGVAREVKIGKVTLRNVVFLVFEDKALYISQIPFQINGLIGFPVIEAFGEITFERNGEIIIPAKPGRGGVQNMCLDDLNPVIEGQYKGKNLSFLLDTGANTSDLYRPFYKAYEKEIKALYPLRTSNRVGVGDAKESPAYRAKNLALTFSGKRAVFPQVTILIDYTDDDSHYFYGNLGQDLVKQFKAMTLNFQSMSIIFQ